RLPCVQQKRGRRSPPFLAGRTAYRFLPPFFFPPLAAFFAIAPYPPLRVGSPSRRAITVSQRHLPTGTPAVRPDAAHSHSLVRGSVCSACSLKKNRGSKASLCLPPDRSAAVSASFRPFSCRPLRSSSPLVPPWNVAAQLLPVTRDYNRWAERSTLIQDVDYG